MNGLTMDGERAVVLDVSKALYAAAERLPSGSPWIDAFCEIAQLIEGDTRPGGSRRASGSAPAGDSGPSPRLVTRRDAPSRSPTVQPTASRGMSRAGST